MGCFESKPEQAEKVGGAREPQQSETKPLIQSSQTETSNPVIESKEGEGIKAPTIESNENNPIPRPKIEITDADRAKLKLKHQRDVLETTISSSESVIQRDRKLAAQLHGEGKTESAKVLVRRILLIRKRVEISSAQLQKVQESIGNIETAEATATVLSALEDGTKVLEMLNKTVTVERAEEVMRESADALAYVDEVSKVLENDPQARDVDDEEYASIIAELDEFADMQATETTIEALEGMPDVPTEEPPRPAAVAEEHEEDAHVDEVVEVLQMAEEDVEIIAEPEEVLVPA